MYGQNDQTWSFRFDEEKRQYQYLGCDGEMEESVVSCNCAVSTCDLNDEPEHVWHDNDALFRTPKICLLPSKFCSASTNAENMAEHQK